MFLVKKPVFSDSVFIACLPEKVLKIAVFSQKLPFLKKRLFIDAFHMSPHSRWFFWTPRKWLKIGQNWISHFLNNIIII